MSKTMDSTVYKSRSSRRRSNSAKPSPSLKSGGKSSSRRSADASGYHSDAEINAVGMEEYEAIKNELDIIRAENKQLKRLIDSSEHTLGATGDSGTSPDPALLESITHLRREYEDLQIKAARAEERLLKKELTDSSYLQERNLEISTLKEKVNSLQNQLQFGLQQYQQELNEKEEDITSLQLKLLYFEDAVKNTHLAQEDDRNNESEDIEEIREKYMKACGELELLKASDARKSKEIVDLQRKIDETGDSQELASQRERLILRISILEKDLENALSDWRKAEKELVEVNIRLSKLEEENDSLEKVNATLKSQLMDANDKLSNSGILELRHELAERDKSVWDLSERLLAQTSQNNLIEEELIQLRKAMKKAPTTATPPPPSPTQNLPSSSPHTPLLPSQQQHTPPPMEKEHTPLSPLVQQQQSMASELAVVRVKEENLLLQASNDNLNAKLGSLERKIEKLKKQLQDSKSMREADRSSLLLPRNLVLPLPSDGGSEVDHLKIELQLKEFALRKLCIKNEQLLQIIDLNNSWKPDEEERYQSSMQETELIHQNLIEAKNTIGMLNNAKMQLSAELERLKSEKTELMEDSVSSHSSLKELAEKYSGAIIHYRDEINMYAKLLGNSFNEIDRLNVALSRESNRRYQLDVLRAERDKAAYQKGIWDIGLFKESPNINGKRHSNFESPSSGIQHQQAGNLDATGRHTATETNFSFSSPLNNAPNLPVNSVFNSYDKSSALMKTLTPEQYMQNSKLSSSLLSTSTRGQETYMGKNEDFTSLLGVLEQNERSSRMFNGASSAGFSPAVSREEEYLTIDLS